MQILIPTEPEVRRSLRALCLDRREALTVAAHDGLTSEKAARRHAMHGPLIYLPQRAP